MHEGEAYAAGIVTGYREACDLLRACLGEFRDHAGRCRGMDQLREAVTEFLKRADDVLTNGEG